MRKLGVVQTMHIRVGGFSKKLSDFLWGLTIVAYGSPELQKNFWPSSSKQKISKLSDSAEIENTKPPEPPHSKNTQIVNFGP